MPQYIAQTKYHRAGSNECRAVVLTPDGGIIECTNQAAAERIAEDFNALCARIVELDPDGSAEPRESDQVTTIIEPWAFVERD